MDNYGFPGAYQTGFQQSPQYYQPAQAVYPRYQQSTFTGMQPNQPVGNQIVWVQGEEAARAYILPNNSTLPLWDSEANVIYIKSVDANGRPSMTILDYVDRNAPAADEEKPAEYATTAQVAELTAQYSDIAKKLESMGSYVTADKFEALSANIKDLGRQIKDIEDRITSFGKPQQNNNRRGNK